MAWFKVDDGFYSSSKVLSIPRSSRLQAVGLWALAGAWAAKELTDGQVPGYVLDELGATPRLRQALVKARLWLDGPEGGIVFHDWESYQPTRAQVEEYRERERDRKRRARSVRADTERTAPGSGAESVPESVLPDPTRPINTTPNGVVSRKRGAQLPEPFIVTVEMRLWAAAEVPGVDVDAATRRFVDHWRAATGQAASKRDWVAAWRNWLRRDADHRTAPAPRPSKNDRALAVIEMGRQMASNPDSDRQEVVA